MKNVNQIVRSLQKLGYDIQYCDGSLVKIYPNNPKLPYYALHMGERAIHPLKRFAKKNWGGLDLSKL